MHPGQRHQPMDKSATIAQIREQLRKGELEPALDRLIEALEQDRTQHRDLANRALQAKAQLEKSQRDEAAGVVSFDNSQLSYNRITQQVIYLLEEWENPNPAKSGASGRRVTPIMIGVAVMVLAFAGIIIFQLVRPERSQDVVVKEGCPAFDAQSKFNILVMPYFALLGDPLPLHNQIVRRLDRIKGEFEKIPTSIGKIDNPAPDTDSDAVRMGERCQARLLIWGTSETMTADRQKFLVSTSYKFLNLDEYFTFTKLTIDDKNDVEMVTGTSNIPTQGIFLDTLTSLTDIATQGALTDFLENQIRLLFGLAALQTDEPKLAAEILSETEPKDSTSRLLKGMALAQSHLATGDTEKAAAAYDEVLTTHPNYNFALNNRALLNFQRGFYAEALEDLNTQLEENERNVDALIVRSAVFMKADQLQKAREDLNQAARLAPEAKQPVVEKKVDLLNEKVEKEEERKEKAVRRIRRDPGNTAALLNYAEATRNLGEYAEADRAATKVLQQDRDNTSALAIRVEAALEMEQQPERAGRILQATPVPDQKVLEERPILRIYFKERKQQ